MAMLTNQSVTFRTLGLPMGSLATKQQLKNREKIGKGWLPIQSREQY